MSQTVVTVDVGGTGANNANAALTNLGALPTFGGSITGNLNVSNNIVVTGNANLGSYVITGNSVSTVENNGDIVLTPKGTGRLRVRSKILSGNGAEAYFDTAGIDESSIGVGSFHDSNGAAELLIVNKNSGTLAYSEMIAINDVGDQEQGWISVGVNSSGYDDPDYTLTGPDDGYLLFEAPQGTTANGDLIVATGSYGLNNKIVLAAGGFNPSDAQLIVAPADLKRANLTSYIVASNVVTFTTDITHTFVANDIVAISDVGAPYDGTRTITNVSSNTFNVSVTVSNVGPINLSPAGFAIQFLPFNKGTVELTAQLFVGENSRSTIETADITLIQGHAIPLGIVVDNDGPGQTVMFNKSNGTLSYSEFIAHNDAGNVEMGWISMGINSSGYDDPEFPITKADDAYLLYEPPLDTAGDGDLIIGTGTNGQKNRLIFAAEGFDEANAQMIITPDESVRISIPTDATSANTGALQVVGGVGVQGSMYVQGNQTIQGDLIVNGSQVIQSIENLAAAGPISLLSDGNIANTWDQGVVGTYAIPKSANTQSVILKSIANNTGTLVTSGNHIYVAEDYATIGNVDATFNGTHRITSVTANSISFFLLANNLSQTAASGDVTVDKAARYTGVVKRATDGNWRFFSGLGSRPAFNTDFADANLEFDSIIAGNGDFRGTLKLGSPNTATLVYSDANNRTFTIPAVGGNRTFAFINEAQTFTAAQAVSSTVTATKFIPTAGDATGNGLYLSGANKLGLTADGVERVSISASETVINDGSADYDFRVESDGNANMLFVDGGNNRVGIGTGAPVTTLHVLSPGTEGVIFNNASGDRISFTTPNRGSSPNVFGLATGQHAIVSVGEGIATNLAIGTFSTGSLVLGTANTERVRVTSGGDVGIGTTDPSAKLHVIGNIRSDSGSIFGGLSAFGGRRNTQENNNFLKIGTWRNVAQSDRLSLRIIGSASYSAGLNPCGETLIMLSFVNNNTAEGRFYSTGKHANITNVAVKTSVDGSNYQVEVWVTVGNYGSTAVIPMLAGGYWDAADTDTGSGSTPAGATLLTSSLGFHTAGAERFSINSSGDVGIGETSPTNVLHINRNATNANTGVTLSNDSEGEGYGTSITFQGAFGAPYAARQNIARVSAIVTSAAGSKLGDLLFSTGSGGAISEKVRIDSSGNVGIGTSVPYSKLEVSGSTFNRLTVTATTNVQSGIQIRRTGATAATDWEIYTPEGSTDLRFYNSSDKVTLTSGGNVGIGTTSPSTKLDVEGSGAGGLLHINNTTAGKSGMAFQDNGSQKLIIGLAGYWEGNSSTDGAIATETGSNIRFYTNGSGTERMRIDTSGNVGIGTSSPTNRLEVDGGSSSTRLRISTTNEGAGAAGIILSNSSKSAFNDGIVIAHGGGYTTVNDLSGNNLMTFECSSTRVGIGTTSPAAKLHLEGADAVSEVRLSRASTTIWGSIQQTSFSGAIGLAFNANDGNAATPGFVWRTATNGSTFTERMRLTTTGLSMTGTLDISTSGMKSVIEVSGSGTYYSNTWYEIASGVSLPTEGMYVVIAFVDTYGAGGGFYYMRFGSVPFYWYPVNSNGPESYELPAMIGTGHAANGEPPPKIRVRQTYSNAGTFVEMQPGANWSTLNGTGGRRVIFEIRRIA